MVVADLEEKVGVHIVQGRRGGAEVTVDRARLNVIFGYMVKITMEKLHPLFSNL